MFECSRCHASKSAGDFYPDRSKHTGHHTICKECVKADRRARYAADPAKYRARNATYWLSHKDKWLDAARRLRTRVLEEYGGACACCGEATPEFLGIDHIFDDGEAHRRQLKGYGRAIYRWLASNGFPKDRFQLLCHNCNVAKGCYGGCPHKGPVPYRRRKNIAA